MLRTDFSAEHQSRKIIRRPARLLQSRSKGLGRIISFLLYVNFLVFYASYVYDARLSGVLSTAKWIPFLLLASSTIILGRRRFLGSISNIAVLPVLILVLLCFGLTVVSLGGYSNLLIGFGFITGVILSLMLADHINSNNGQIEFFDVLANCGRLVIAASFVFALLGISLGRGDGRFSGWTDNPNSLGLILAPAIVVLLAFCLTRRRGWLVWSLPFAVAGLYILFLTQSRASISWVLISFTCLVLARLGSGKVAFVSLVALAGFLAIGGDFVVSSVLNIFSRTDVHGSEVALLSGRAEAWAIAMELIAKQPVTGYGLGASQSILYDMSWRFTSHHGLHFHSSYLTILVEVGFVTLFIFTGLVVFALFKGFEEARSLRRRPGNQWLSAAMPWAIMVGALGHAAFESWLFSAGNANMLTFWTILLLIASSRVRKFQEIQEGRRV